MVDQSVVDEVRSLGLATSDFEFRERYDRLLSAVAASIARSSRDEHNMVMSGFYEFIIKNSASSNSQLFQDLWVAYESNEKRDGYFVEFGACDGVYLSNTHLLEKVYGWTGIIGDPNPRYKKALRKNRTCRVTNRCIFPGPRRRRTFRCTDDGAFSTLEEFAQLDSNWDRHRSSNYEHVNVYTVSINDVLEEFGAPRVIDYLSLDTEGSEFAILQDLDFGRWKIGLITVEHNYTPNREKIHDLLTRNGYLRKLDAISKWDDWYVKQ